MTNLFSKIATTEAVLLGTSGIIGCGSTGNEKYEFSGLIGKEWVEFHTENFLGDKDSKLTVRTEEGVTKVWRDTHHNDLKIEDVVVDGPCGYTRHSVYNKCSLEPLAEEQAEFESYLGKILDEKERIDARRITEEKPIFPINERSKLILN